MDLFLRTLTSSFIQDNHYAKYTTWDEVVYHYIRVMNKKTKIFLYYGNKPTNICIFIERKLDEFKPNFSFKFKKSILNV